MNGRSLISRAHCVPEMVTRAAAKSPDALVVSAAGGILNYRELESRANRLAHHLHSLGVARETLVGTCFHRSPSLVVAALAIMKARGAYLPLDPSLPKERLDFMLRDSGAPILISAAHLANRFHEICGHRVFIDEDKAEISKQPATPLGEEVLPNTLAYVIYTSGSIGVPKGIEVTPPSSAEMKLKNSCGELWDKHVRCR